MADYSTTLYDTAPFATSAAQEHVLFQVTQGADATHTESFTNMRGNGSLPNEESFLVKKLKVILDGLLLLADVPDLFFGSFLEIRLSDKTVFKAPLSMCIAHSEFTGHYSQTTAADKQVIGMSGNGYALEIPIPIKGGTSFRVRVYQHLAVTTSAVNMKVVLEGTLTTPN